MNRIYAKRKGVVSPNKKRGFSSLSRKQIRSFGEEREREFV